jgi:hypothetical protein
VFSNNQNLWEAARLADARRHHRKDIAQRVSSPVDGLSLESLRRELEAGAKSESRSTSSRVEPVASFASPPIG